MKKITFISVCAIVLSSCGLEDSYVQNQMDKVEIQVAKDAEAQYNLALKGGDKTEIYVHAGFVAAAYLQANDSVNYIKWKEIERKHAKESGMPID